MSNRFLQAITGLFKPRGAVSETARPSVVAEASTAPTSGRRVITEDEHSIPRKYLDDNAAKVVYRLTDQGYEAYLVGGCIRDLLLKKRPKDFDVATSAHPEEAHELFKRSRLIGRRFKLLHVRFGRDIIEVATFRAGHDSADDDADEIQGKQADSGLILRDNVYGSIEDDAARRDFTINALYYCVNKHAIYDYTQGYEDLKKGLIRMIGDPESRYREDPVRMLRAVRFAAKLGFAMEPATEAPIRPLAHLLQNIAAARLFDEVLKLLQSGHGVASLQQLRDYNLLEQILPLTAKTLASQDTQAEALIINGLKNTDRRLQQRKSVTPAFLFATLLWHPLVARMEALQKDNPRMPAMIALNQAANDVLGAQVKRTAIPRRFSTPIREIWELQLRLPKRFGNKAEQLIEHPRFRAAYDLLLLREQSGEALDNLGQWWTEYQSANAEQRQAMTNALNKDKPARKPRRRSRAKNDPRNPSA